MAPWYCGGMHEPKTVETQLSATVVVVGGPPALVEATQLVAQLLPRVSVQSCAVPQAATTVAKALPFAIVMSEDVYVFDPHEFDALARDVRAKLVQVPSDQSAVDPLARLLRTPLVSALRARLG